jgi:hypothetical protein
MPTRVFADQTWAATNAGSGAFVRRLTFAVTSTCYRTMNVRNFIDNGFIIPATNRARPLRLGRLIDASASGSTRGAVSGIASALTLLGMLAGCASNTDPTAGLVPAPAVPSTSAVAPPTNSSTRGEIRAERPAAIIGNRAVGRDELWPAIAERAGREVLEELAIDQQLRARLTREGLSISDADVERERQTLIEFMSRRAGIGTRSAEETLIAIRRERGLGDTRFRALLERNAMLRALVKPQTVVGNSEIDQALDIRFGQRYAARVILVKSESEAANLRSQLSASTDRMSEFSRAAMRSSIDPSGPAGGTLPPIALSDPTYPSEIRNALRQMNPGDLSPVIAVDRGFAFVILDRVEPAAGAPTTADRDAAERDATLNAERAAMERLATQLLAESGVTALDPALRWGWEQR